VSLFIPRSRIISRERTGRRAGHVQRGLCGGDAPHESLIRWAAIKRKVVSFFNAVAWCGGTRTPCCSQRANRARDARPWCWRWLRSALSHFWCRSRPVVLGVVPSRVVRPNAAGCIVAAHLPHASSGHAIGAAAQHGVPADRFAREIAGFLTLPPGALAAAERQPVRHPWQGTLFPLLHLDAVNGDSRRPVLQPPSCRSPFCRSGTQARCAEGSWCRAWYERPWC